MIVIILQITVGLIKMKNKKMRKDKKKFLELLRQAGFKDIKQFADLNKIGLGYSTVVKWGNEKDKNGRVRPVPKWIFSWLRLYIENREFRSSRKDSEIIIENIQLKEKIESISNIIKS